MKAKIVVNHEAKPAERYEVHVSIDGGVVFWRHTSCPTLALATALCRTIQGLSVPEPEACAC